MNEAVPNRNIHPDIPSLFLPACADLFSVEMDGERMFINRSWVSKPLEGTNTPSPACFIVSAVRLSDANLVARSVRSILDYIGSEAKACRLTVEQIDAILWSVKRRVKLLTLQEGINLFMDLGIPVYYRNDHLIEDVLTIPFVTGVGFRQDKINLYRPLVPNKC